MHSFFQAHVPADILYDMKIDSSMDHQNTQVLSALIHTVICQLASISMHYSHKDSGKANLFVHNWLYIVIIKYMINDYYQMKACDLAG